MEHQLKEVAVVLVVLILTMQGLYLVEVELEVEHHLFLVEDKMDLMEQQTLEEAVVVVQQGVLLETVQGVDQVALV